MAITLTEARTDLLAELRDLSDVPQATFILWGDYINKFAYRFLIGIDPNRFVSTQSYTVTTNPQTTALPVDFRDIQPLGCGFFLVDDNSKQTDQILLPSSFGAQYKGYYLQGSNVVFTGMDDGSAYTLRYIPSVSKLTQMTDVFVLPDEYNRYVLDALKVMYFIWDEDPGGESFSDARFVRSLDELANTISQQAQSFMIPNFSSMY